MSDESVEALRSRLSLEQAAHQQCARDYATFCRRTASQFDAIQDSLRLLEAALNGKDADEVARSISDLKQHATPRAYHEGETP